MPNLQNHSTSKAAAEQQQPKIIKKKLTGKEKAFVLAYVGESRFNATKAAELAGYNAKTRETFAAIGYENLRKPHISAFIDEFFDDALMQAKECLMRITDIARGSIQDLLNDQGNFDYKNAKENGSLHMVKKLKIKRTSKVVKKEQDSYPDPNSDQLQEIDETLETSLLFEEIEFEIHDPLQALQLIGKHHKLFTDNHHLTGDLEFVTFEIETASGKKLESSEESE